MKRLSRSGIVLGVIGVILVVIVAVALVLALRGPVVFDPGTPEATVQGYLQAVIDEDQTEAVRYLTPELAKRCESDFYRVRYYSGSFEAVIADTRPSGARTLITVEITEGSGSELFGNSYSFEETLVLEKNGDTWFIAEAPWPIYCGEV